MEEKLIHLLFDMDIPDNRRDVFDFGNISWMTRNLAIRNRENENFEEAMQIIKQLYKKHISS